MNADQLCGLLAEPSRLRVYCAVVLGAGTPEEIAGVTGLGLPVVAKAVQRLSKSDLLVAGESGLVAEEGVFKDVVREGRPERVPLDEDPGRDAVLRSFIRDGQLTVLPTVPAKFRIVLEHLAGSFDLGTEYPEATVNAILNSWHPDHATLRRQLVDYGFLTRDNSLYRRTA